jgi:heme-degrading monooxygenase HmoA
MRVGLVAFHYPKPEHRDELIERVRRAAEVMAAVPGCLTADCWLEEGTGAVVTTGIWASRDALAAGFDAVAAAGVDIDYDEREARPREVFTLAPASVSRRTTR